MVCTGEESGVDRYAILANNRHLIQILTQCNQQGPEEKIRYDIDYIHWHTEMRGLNHNGHDDTMVDGKIIQLLEKWFTGSLTTQGCCT